VRPGRVDAALVALRPLQDVDVLDAFVSVRGYRAAGDIAQERGRGGLLVAPDPVNLDAGQEGLPGEIGLVGAHEHLVESEIFTVHPRQGTTRTSGAVKRDPPCADR
jgi:hypothetical protein